MASNSRTLRDDFGQFEDWIEVYNSSAQGLSLEGWALTDSANEPTKWRFPATNLPPRSNLVVFASGRDRRTPGLPLHANFRLSAEGEYLALVNPSGTFTSRFSPQFPPQMGDVSFGLAPRTGGELLVNTQAIGRVWVPADAALGTNWTAPEFDDTAWFSATNGIGFETGEPDDPATVSAKILSDHPAGYWRLGETGGALVPNSGTAGEKGAGQAVGGVVFGIAGPRPPALPGFESDNLAARFNGGGAKVEIPYTPELNPNGPFTVELWAKPARAGGPAAWVFSSLNVATGRNGYALAQDYTAKNTWEFRLGDTAGYIAMAYGGAVDTNRWQHVVGVYDGTTARLFLNGALAASATLGRPFQANATEKTVIGGRINEPNPYYYAGDVDEVAVIPRALSAAEIASRYQMATNPTPSSGVFHYADLIQTDLRSQMLGHNSSAYLRLPFLVDDPARWAELALRVKFEDGLMAWLNGVPVAESNAPALAAWNAAATTRRAASDATRFTTFDLVSHLPLLRPGTNLLALQGLNLDPANPDFLLLCELEASAAGAYLEATRYFVVPSPGGPNGAGTADLGPILSSAEHGPALPGTNDSITVTCQVTPAFDPIAGVTLHWRVMFNALNQAPMFDDGLHCDGAAGDGVYGAVIPSTSGGAPSYTAGQMVRWFVTAADTQGRSSRWPLFESATGSAEYLGTVVQPDYVTSRLPVFHLFAPANVLQPGPTTQQIGADSESGGRVALYYDGEFYDNIYMELRGNTSAGLNKKAHRLEFNREHPFRHPGPGGRIRKSSLLAEHLDPAFIRQHLCFWFLDQMGVPSPFDYPVRAQLNGAFYQLAFHTDVLGEEQLERLGYDPEGALYKCAGQVNPQFSSTGGFQKLLPRTNLVDRSDYLQLANGINESQSLTVRRATVFDLLDVAQVVNYLAGARWCAENDDVWANMCLYRDTHGDGLWRIIPFDMNASWGQLYGGVSPLQANNDFGKSHPFYGGSQVQEGGSSAWNRLYDVIIALPETRDMLRRRQRSLLDQWVLPPGTPSGALIIENYIRQMTNQIHVEANLDRQKWGYSPWASGQNFAKGVGDLFTQFLPLRRSHWYITHSITNTAKPLGLGNAYNAGLPLSQPSNAAVSIVAWDVNPASGNQDHEFICLTNQNSYAVDLSGWRVDGAVRHRFRPGTVIPPAGSLFLSPNVAAFRARPTPPRGGQGLFIQGDYEGRLNAWGETLRVEDAAGRNVSVTNTLPAPSFVQRYLRITEIMYNPAPAADPTVEAQRFEYLKLKNISADTTLNLAGVRLTNGVYFQFAATSLPPGETRLLVRDTNAFALRYGSGLPVAGQFTGALDNAGETLRLEDATGEKVLEFAYDPAWYPITDGLGFSLVIADEGAPWSAWGRKESWRSSGLLHGSPGEALPAPLVAPPIRINEILAHSHAPLTDTIELFNPADTNVDVGHWLLTDDFYVPAKYQFPAGSWIPAGGFLVVLESQFGAGAGGFRLSQAGEAIHLFSAAPDRTLTGYTHGFDFGYAPGNVTIGGHVTSQGDEHFVPQAAPTLGAPNVLPRVGPVVVSEIHYHPPDGPGGEDNDLDEFLELRNLSATNVPLFCTFTNLPGYGLDAATNTWRLDVAVEFAFPTNLVLGPHATLLVVGFDPANSVQLGAFRDRFAIPSEVPVYGPWQGKLDNSGERIELRQPDEPEVSSTNATVPFVVVDRVSYFDQPPWPLSADGSGHSLQRFQGAEYGDDPVNWYAALPSAGRPGMAPPRILVAPASRVVEAGETVRFEVSADGAEPLSFQWHFEGSPMAQATNAVLLLPQAQPEHQGGYSVAVANPVGVVTSLVATLTVTVPPLVLEQLRVEDSEVQIFVPSWRGLTYHLEYKNDLGEPNWRTLTPALPGSGGLLLFKDALIPGANRFYRIRTGS